MDARVREPLLEQSLWHRDLELLVLRQLPVDAERAHRERLHELERETERYARRRLGRSRDAGVQDEPRSAVWTLFHGRSVLGYSHHELLQLRPPGRAGGADRHTPPGTGDGARLPRREAVEARTASQAGPVL